MPAIVRRDAIVTTPYFRLVGKHVEGDETDDPHYALELSDYVAVVACTLGGDFVLVRQFRPAVEAQTLELPAGHVDPGHTPEEAARKELLEETGCVADRVIPVGCLRPDTGRLGNRMWVFFAPGVERRAAKGEEADVEVVVATPAELSQWITDGAFDHALHVAALFLTVRAGFLQFPPGGPR